MKWFDEIADGVTYPLRATLFDKVLMVIQVSVVLGLVAVGLVSLYQWLCA